MTITTLQALTPGDTFTFRGEEYIKVSHGRGSKDHIARLSDSKLYDLSARASVDHMEHDPLALQRVLRAKEEAHPSPSLLPGTKVRVVDNPRTRKQGINGVESIVVRTNQKTYSLANGWRISPGWVEKVDD